MITQRVPSVGTFCSEKNNWSQGKTLQWKEGNNTGMLLYFFKPPSHPFVLQSFIPFL